MKSKKNLFLTTVVLCCVGFLCPQQTLAEKTCNPGSYHGYGCQDCPPGCYCVGGTTKTGTGWVWSIVRDFCRDRKGSASDYVNNNAKDIKLCPADYKNSDQNAKSEEDCYTSVDGKRIYAKKIDVPAGYYLPVDTADPAKCPTTKVCKGSVALGELGGVWPRLSSKSMKEWGIQDCPSGQKPNSDNSDCVEDSITCEAGEYYSDSKKQCETCPAGSECPGTGALKAPKKDTGKKTCKGDTISVAGSAKCEKCPDGKKANSAHTACTDSSLKPGYYFQKGKDDQTECTGENKYCPGGDYAASDEKDVGIFDCPKGTRSNKKRTACQKGFSKDALLYGSGGKGTPVDSQCWTKAGEPEKYRECVFNNRYYK